MTANCATPNPAPRDFSAEYKALERERDDLAREKDALYAEWAASLKARIARLRNPETGRKLSLSAVQRLLPDYSTTSPILLNALRGDGKSVPLLLATERVLDALEADPRYQPVPDEDAASKPTDGHD